MQQASPRAGTTFGQMLILPILVIVIWYILSRLVFVVPVPYSAVKALVGDIAQEQYRSDLLDTAEKIVVAFAVSTFIGIVGGAFLGLVRVFRELFEPFLLIANGVPKIVVYPILLIIFGLGGTSQIVMGVIFGTLPILVNLTSSLASMRPVYRKVARMFELSPVRAIFHVYIPAVAPMLMVALQLGFSLTVLGVIFSEIIASRHGLGQRLIQTYSVGNYDQMAATILCIVFIALSGAGLLHLLERSVTRYRQH
jgi:NitT/TauT family transport system permease protein